MSDELQYIVMGDDGNEYGPVSAGQVRDWIRENRLERKTPVKAGTAKDWVFLHMLPEFAGAFNQTAPAGPKKSNSRAWLVILLLAALGAAIFLLLKINHH